MSHRYRCRLRWGDMDAQGHVNNAAYLDYLQDARIDFLTGAGIGDLLDRGVLVVAHQVEYHRPVVVDGQDAVVDLWVESVGGSRFVVGYAVHDGEPPGSSVAVGARTSVVPFDLATGRLRRLTPAERAAIGPYVDPQPPLRPVARTVVGEWAHDMAMTVRWSDLDAYGHVNNVKYFDYVQEARIALLRDSVGFDDQVAWLLVRQDVEYLRPTDFRSTPYTVRTAVAAVGRRSLTLATEVLDPRSGAVHARGRSVVVGPTPFTDEQRRDLHRWSAPHPP